MAPKRSRARFELKKTVRGLAFTLLDAKGNHVAGAIATSQKKAEECVDILCRKFDSIAFKVKHINAARGAHWYFQGFVGTKKILGAGGFATEDEALAHIERIRKCAAEAAAGRPATS